METAPARALHACLPLGGRAFCEEHHGAHSRSQGACALSRECLSLSPLTVRSHADVNALAMTLHDHLLHVCGLVTPGRGLLTATGTVQCACALGVTTRGLNDCTRDRLAVARPGVTARSHTGPASGHVAVAGVVTALLLLTARGLGRGVGGLDGVAGIALRLLMLPAIVATLC